MAPFNVRDPRLNVTTPSEEIGEAGPGDNAQHGGDLTVESEPGRFTIFKVSLPQALPAESGAA